MGNTHFAIEVDPLKGLPSAEITYFGPSGSVSMPLFRQGRLKVRMAVTQKVDEQIRSDLQKAYGEAFGI